MNVKQDLFGIGLPAGIRNIARDSAGRLVAWTENGYAVSVRRDSSGLPVEMVANGRTRLACRYIYAGGYLVAIEGDPIPTQLQHEVVAGGGLRATSFGALDGAVMADDRNRALRAWRQQPKTYKLAVVPDPTIFIDFNRGNDANAGTKAAPYKTIGKLLTALPSAGACIGLANDSLFDFTDRLSFTGATAINGASESNRVTFTNYDPGGYPTQRPRIRFRYLPTAGNWTWDATVQAWYYTHPSNRAWGSYNALARFAGAWGQSRSTNLPALVAGLLSRDRDYYADDTTKRIYVYAPAGTDPTTYYGGPGSIILGETEGSALNFSRCGKFVTLDNLIFEDCGTGTQLSNFSATEDLAGFVVQRCQFLNVGRGVAFATDSSSNFTQSGRILENIGRNAGSMFVHLPGKATLTDVAGNLFSGPNQSSSHGGALYVQGSSSGVQTMTGNRCFENYVEDAKFNRGNCAFDGAGLYFEVRARGWDCYKNFITRCHHGVCNNTGMTLNVRHNVFDDVDLPYVVADGMSLNTINSTFEHNTAVNCGITKYRTGDSAIDPARTERDPIRAALGMFDNVASSAVLSHRNNIIHVAGNAPLVAGMELRRGATLDASGNHFFGQVKTDPVETFAYGTANQVLAAANTTAGNFVLGSQYEPVSGVPTAPALASLPSPLDLYGMASPSPYKGAVSL